MSLSVHAWTTEDRETLRALLADPSLAAQFDKFQGPHGLEHKLHDPRLDPAALRLARWDGEPAGFALAWILPGETHWIMMRVGVVERFRRRGIGRRLAEAVLEHVRRTAPGPRLDVAGSAWLPNPAAEAFAAHLGLAHERWFWMMERPRGNAPAPVWPEATELRPFVGGDAALAEWTEAYNDSFSEHYRWVRADETVARQIAADPAFRADGLLLAYRGGRCVGFCRNELHATRGEIGTLGVVHAARGLGLGRALLRWGVRWLEAATPLPVTLLVDGENEGALRLYRSEGFEIARTRRIWNREFTRLG